MSAAGVWLLSRTDFLAYVFGVDSHNFLNFLNVDFIYYKK